MNNTVDKFFSRVFFGFRSAVAARHAVLRTALDDGFAPAYRPTTPHGPARHRV